MSLGSDLLECLTEEDFGAVRRGVTEIRLLAGEVLYDPGDDVDYCYFPRGEAIASYFVVLDNGTAVETVLIGREGAIGGIVSHGSAPSYARAVVIHDGTFWKVPVRELEQARRENTGIDSLLSRYADCLMAQVFQSIACNAVHTIEQRAAKWLVAAVDRIGRDDVTMTQEQLASMMGIGRSYASRVIQRLKREGLLRTRRGGIRVLDREGLRDHACSCNDHVKRHFEAAMGGVYPER
jgi:CRP-like cAMP-binding protein